MTQVNLLPWREKILCRRKRLWQSGILLLVLILAAFVTGSRYYINACRIRSDLWVEQQQVMIQSTLSLINRQQQLNVQLRELQQEHELRQRQRVRLLYWRQLLSQLPAAMPASVWLHSLRQQPGSLVLRGQTDTLMSLLRFSRCLRQQPFFTRIDIQELGTAGTAGYRFSLKAVLAEMMEFSEGSS